MCPTRTESPRGPCPSNRPVGAYSPKCQCSIHNIEPVSETSIVQASHDGLRLFRTELLSPINGAANAGDEDTRLRGLRCMWEGIVHQYLKVCRNAPRGLGVLRIPQTKANWPRPENLNR